MVDNGMGPYNDLPGRRSLITLCDDPSLHVTPAHDMHMLDMDDVFHDARLRFCVLPLKDSRASASVLMSDELAR